MALKDRLKYMRNDKGVTITQLAAHLNKGESAVRMWELGRSNPDLETLANLSQYYECTTDYLLGLSEYRNPEEKEIVKREVDDLFERIRDLPTDESEAIRKFIGNAMLLVSYESTPELFLNYMNNLSSIASCYFDLIRLIQDINHTKGIAEMRAEAEIENEEDDENPRIYPYLDAFPNKFERITIYTIEELSESLASVFVHESSSMSTIREYFTSIETLIFNQISENGDLKYLLHLFRAEKHNDDLKKFLTFLKKKLKEERENIWG